MGKVSGDSSYKKMSGTDGEFVIITRIYLLGCVSTGNDLMATEPLYRSIYTNLSYSVRFCVQVTALIPTAAMEAQSFATRETPDESYEVLKHPKVTLP